MTRLGLALQLLLIGVLVFLWVMNGWSGFAFVTGALAMCLARDVVDKGWRL